MYRKMSGPFDVIIIGAGVEGLVTAKTFLNIDPDLDLLILESQRTLGGVWAEQRLYPGLLANNILGTYEFTDFPMDHSFGVEPGQHIPGEVIYKYLCRYAKHFGLEDRLLCEVKVDRALQSEAGWELTTSSGRHFEGTGPLLLCSRLIIATGLHSKPNAIDFPGSSSLTRPLILNLGENPAIAAALVTDPSIKHITVYGGSKTAHDAIYKLASDDKIVSWVIAESGHGATPMIPSRLQIGPWKVWTEYFIMRRPLAWLDPCIWAHFDGFGPVHDFMQTTRVGQYVVRKILNFVEAGIFHSSGISSDPQSRMLMPDQDLSWYGSGAAILNYPTDFYEYIRSGQVEVTRKDIAHLEHGMVRFSDGSAMLTDVVFYSAGWDHIPSIELHPSSIHADIGFPSREYTNSQTSQWTDLDNRADCEILKRLPMLLKNRPKRPREDAVIQDGAPIERPTPWRLWRGVAPPSAQIRNIVFLGMFDCPQTCLRAEVSALWAYAYMFNKLEEPVKSISTMPSTRVDSQEERLFDTALFQRFGFWRTPYGHGVKYADCMLEGLPYIDMLLQDMVFIYLRRVWCWVGEILGGGTLMK